MRKDRLLKLADFLDTLPPGRFNYQHWAAGTDLSCGTTACALGWATTIPEFGLELRREPLDGIVYIAVKDTPVYRVPVLAYGDSVASAFGLAEDDADLMFIPTEYIRPRFEGDLLPGDNASPAEVAAQIRAVIAHIEAR